LVDEPVGELHALLLREAAAFREQVLLHDPDRFFSLLEAGQIALAHHHHFN